MRELALLGWVPRLHPHHLLEQHKATDSLVLLAAQQGGGKWFLLTHTDLALVIFPAASP